MNKSPEKSKEKVILLKVLLKITFEILKFCNIQLFFSWFQPVSSWWYPWCSREICLKIKYIMNPSNICLYTKFQHCSSSTARGPWGEFLYGHFLFVFITLSYNKWVLCLTYCIYLTLYWYIIGRLRHHWSVRLPTNSYRGYKYYEAIFCSHNKAI